MKTNFFKTGSIATWGLVVVLVLGLVGAVILVGRQNIFQNQAASNSAVVSMVADNTNLGDDEQASVTIFIDPKASQMVFANIDVKFDPNILNFDGLTDLNAKLQPITVSSLEEANLDGKVRIAVFVPKERGAIGEPLQFAKLKFSPSAKAVGVTNPSIVLDQTSKIVVLPSQNLDITAAPLNLKVNSRERISQDMGLKITGKDQNNKDKQLVFSWNTVADKDLLRYRVVIMDSNGNRANPDQGAVAKGVTTYSPTQQLAAGNYNVTLSAVLPNKVFRQVKNFQIGQNSELAQ